MIVETKGDERFVTYFNTDNKFDRNKIEINVFNSHNHSLSKPSTGWWGSPVDAEYGWKEWCESECFGDYDFDNPIYWTLKPGSKIYQIDWNDVKDNSDLEKYTKQYYPSLMFGKELNFVKIVNDNIVAVQLMNACIGHCFSNDLEIMFNSWDCESIVVLNKDTIVFEK